MEVAPDTDTTVEGLEELFTSPAPRPLSHEEKRLMAIARWEFRER